MPKRLSMADLARIEAESRVKVAHAQVTIMLDQEKHATRLRELELEKAEVELDTAKKLNRAMARIEEQEKLPEIKLS